MRPHCKKEDEALVVGGDAVIWKRLAMAAPLLMEVDMEGRSLSSFWTQDDAVLDMNPSLIE
jgi:hypothetical protein